MCLDPSGNLLVGGSFDNTLDLDPGTASHTITANGLEDCFIGYYDPAGKFIWGGMIGGGDYDGLVDIAADSSGKFYAGGFHMSTDIDLDPGAGTYTVGTSSPIFDLEAYVVKFSICNLNADTISSNTICSGNNVLMGASGSGVIQWYASSSATSAVATGTVYTTPSLSAGTYTYYAGSSQCGMQERIAFDVTVHALPQLTLSTSQPTICNESSAVITLTGAASYSINGVTTAPVFTASPNSTTVYNVSGTDNNGCTGTGSITQYVSDCTGMESLDQNALKIYPNPASSAFTVESTDSDSQMELYDLRGRKVLSGNLSQGNNTVNCEHLPAGLYMIIVKKGGSGIAAGRLVIQ